MSARRRRSRPEAIGPLLRRALQDLGEGELARALRVAECWEQAVGAEVARHCRPIRVRGVVLEASVDSSVWCQQLKLRTPQILAGLQRILGDEAPSELWLRVG